MKRGDVIVSFDGKGVKESNDLPYMVASTPVGKVVTVEVLHEGERKGLQVKIGELEEEKEAGEVGESGTELDLGMQVEQITPEIARYFGLTETRGVVVVDVADNSPAAEAGVRPGDIILEIEQTLVKDVEQFKEKLKDYKPGETILLLVKRQSTTLFLTLKVGK